MELAIELGVEFNLETMQNDYRSCTLNTDIRYSKHQKLSVTISNRQGVSL
ncbi:hypothetical protein [Candidatus Bandiella euplotis]|nr:hypothetical protein [Candidatus Bandiella woodruffii]